MCDHMTIMKDYSYQFQKFNPRKRSYRSSERCMCKYSYCSVLVDVSVVRLCWYEVYLTGDMIIIILQIEHDVTFSQKNN